MTEQSSNGHDVRTACVYFTSIFDIRKITRFSYNNSCCLKCTPSFRPQPPRLSTIVPHFLSFLSMLISCDSTIDASQPTHPSSYLFHCEISWLLCRIHSHMTGRTVVHWPLLMLFIWRNSTFSQIGLIDFHGVALSTGGLGLCSVVERQPLSVLVRKVK